MIARLLIATAGLAHAAAAQTPSFVYSIHAPAALAPGQTAIITVLCGFTPAVGQPVTGGTVAGLHSGAFNLAATSGAWSGNTGIAPYNFLPGLHTFPGTINGSVISGVVWGNGFCNPLMIGTTINPLPVWMATFTMGPQAAFITITPTDEHGICVNNAGLLSPLHSTAVQGAQIVIIPAPAAAALLAGAGFLAPRCRRSTPEVSR